jgi:hypothetical protein
VRGVGADALLAALDKQDPALGAHARDAIANGTLRINGDKISGTR